MQLHRPDRPDRPDKHVSDDRHFGLDSLSMLYDIFLQLKLCEISLIVFVKSYKCPQSLPTGKRARFL